MEISCLTWNIWFDVTHLKKRIRNIMKIVNTIKPEFVAFQEVTSDSIQIIEKYKNDYHIIGDLSYHYDTIILSLYKPILWDRFAFRHSSMGRNILISNFIIDKNSKKIHVSIVTFHLESVFTKNTIKISQFNDLFHLININENVIIMGDTNFKNNDIEPILKDKFADSFINIGSPDEYKNTYSGSSNNNIKNKYLNSRLDRIYFNQTKFDLIDFKLIGTEQTVYITDVYKINPSDHFGIYAKYKIK